MILQKLNKFYIVLFTLSFAFSACEYLKQNKTEEKEAIKIAKVNEEYLYADEVFKTLPSNYTTEDSVYLVNKYISNWISQKLLISKAEENLNEEQKSFEQKIQDYKNSLLIHAYERAIIEQNLDTLVTDDEIVSYYENNKQTFELRDNILKVQYVILPLEAPDQKKFKKLFPLQKEEDFVKLEGYCYQFATKFNLDDKTWILFENLQREIPIRTTDSEKFIKSNKFFELSDSLYNYYLDIKEYKIRNSVSPLSFEKENIRNIIINQRKLLLIKKMKEDIYNDGIKKNYVEIYSQKK